VLAFSPFFATGAAAKRRRATRAIPCVPVRPRLCPWWCSSWTRMQR